MPTIPFARIALVIVLLIASRSFAWGTKEHIVITRLAVNRILEDASAPQGLKDFLSTAMPDHGDLASCKEYFLNAVVGAEPADLKDLSFWVIDPDLRANKDKKTIIEPFGVPERALHFVDLEFTTLDRDKRFYKHDLSNRPALASIPRDIADERFKEAGMLPFAMEHSFKKLVEALKADPKSKDAQRYTGMLVHYAQDNYQPQHATMDYKAASYFADKRSSPNVHSEVEWRMNDDPEKPLPELRAEYWEAFVTAMNEKRPAEKRSGDLWLETLEIADQSYQALPLIGLAAMHATGQGGTPEKPEGKAGAFDTEKFYRFEGEVAGAKTTVLAMKARQQAMAVIRTAELLNRAWSAAQSK